VTQAYNEKDAEVVYGAKAIASIIGESNLRKVFYQLDQGHIPGASRFGKRWRLSIPAWRRAVHGET
jgi:hypothetical protein